MSSADLESRYTVFGLGRLMPQHVHPIPPPAKPGPQLVPLTETKTLIQESRRLREQSRRIRAELKETLGAIQQTIVATQALVAVAPGPDDSASRLTKRECRVLTLIASGYSSKQVAGLLGISFKTVVTHRTHIMEKLKIHETAGLTRFAIRQRLIRP
jgi:DNA-binding NarL/FixJ family response regulator